MIHPADILLLLSPSIESTFDFTTLYWKSTINRCRDDDFFNGHLMKHKARCSFTRSRADDISITGLIIPWQCKDVKSKRRKCGYFRFFFWQRAARNLAARAAHLYFPIRPINFLIDIDVVTVTVIDANGPY